MATKEEAGPKLEVQEETTPEEQNIATKKKEDKVVRTTKREASFHSNFLFCLQI